MADDIVVEGLDALKRALSELPNRIEKNVMRGAMRAAAKVVAADAAKRVHKVSGDLEASIRVGTSSRGGVVSGYVKMGDGKTKAFYGLMAELGTKKHFIRPKNAKELYFGGHPVKLVKHPGAAPHPMLRPALDSRAKDALEAMRDYISGRLPDEVAKLKAESGT